MLPLGLLLMLPLDLQLQLRPKLRVQRLPLTLQRCWYPTRPPMVDTQLQFMSTQPQYLYKTSGSEHVCREGLGVGLCGGINHPSVRAFYYLPRRCPPKRCRRHRNRPL